MKVAIIGAGYVGLTTCVAMAYLNHEVVGVDKDSHKLSLLYRGESPIHEVGLQILLDQTARRITFTDNVIDAVGNADIIMIAVGTPQKQSGEADTHYVEEAAREVAWQLRLRNIGGIVAIDFINMQLPEKRNKVLTELKRALETDPARVRLTQFSQFGLVELTRMRTRRSHAHELTEECEYCQGIGRLKTAYSVAVEVLRCLSVETRFEPGRDFSVIANPEVVAILEGQERAAVEDLQRQSAASFELIPDPSLGREAFELVPV